MRQPGDSPVLRDEEEDNETRKHGQENRERGDPEEEEVEEATKTTPSFSQFQTLRASQIRHRPATLHLWEEIRGNLRITSGI